MSYGNAGVGAGLFRALGLSDKASRLDANRQAELRAAQIQAIVALAPVMMIANVFNALVVDALYWNTPHRWFLTVWSSTICAGVAFWALKRSQSVKAGRRLRASSRGVRRFTISGLICGLVWAAPLVAMFPDVDEGRRVVLATLAAGMITGGALTLATVWQAALAYSAAIEIPFAILVISTRDPVYIGLGVLSFSFLALIARTVFERSRLFVQSFVDSLDLRDQSQVISLLLKEFEENSSDWLFETDAEGCLARVSPRLAAIAQQPCEQLEGSAFAKLLGPDAADHDRQVDPALATLLRAMGRKRAFRDLILRAFIGGEERWWSLSAKPTYAEDGTFSGYRGVGSDISEARRAKASIERMAKYDALTNLPNRNFLQARLRQALEAIDGGGANFAVLSVDLDRFKNVNDTLGHPFGDALLVEVAKRITLELDERDVVARVGGDEFVILQFDVADNAAARGLADRIVKAVAAPYEIQGQRVLVGASAGIAFAPADGDKADDLLRNSDLALYRAKADGKGRYRLFETEMDEVMQVGQDVLISLLYPTRLRQVMGARRT